ncbi:hypothetical protein PHLGIDRAFT_355704 [Phlebiopsis gigantea 11061_1 CR5-6]|uniref:F-box domain-containing protein n=1 Tax=Phlebiopsis gigantea (strain 11061_1 CR5-6) TaxID=745531 RepID=A0A0C3PPR0_PHLG1|nr:hypothetical protein PHLGIDRAFT_355704 [Phlebiopsis gigantea 11061_1 CR5-6]
MTQLPVEILWRIASTACTDGGYTGGSLARVSHFMQNATKPYRYHSISLTSDAQMCTFSEHLEIFHRHRAVPIRHLFFSVKLDYYSTRADTERKHGNSSPRDAFSLVLRTASSTLRSLVIYGNACTFILYHNLNLAFPVLKDLTTHALTKQENMAKRFPSLRRLQFIDQGCDGPDSTTFDTLVPTLTHLRIDSQVLSDHFSLFLYNFLGLLSHDFLVTVVRSGTVSWTAQDTRRAVATAARLPRLQHIFIQPLQLVWMPTSFLKLAQASTFANGARRFYMCPRNGDVMWYTVRDAMLDWQNLVQGGDGPWSVQAPT